MGRNKQSKKTKSVKQKTVKGRVETNSVCPEIVLIGGLVLITLVVFAHTLDFSFINYDDNDYVYDNYMVTRGLSWSGLIWAFTSNVQDHWHPLTWLSHMLDCQLFGLQAGWHHATNLLLHLFNSILLYYFLKLATGYRWRAWLVAAFFAVHPLHVESVVWVSSRKDVLSGFFFMSCLLVYTLYVQQNSKKWYGLVLLTSMCGMLAKSMLVTLPFVLLLLDYWPLQRQRSHLPEGSGGLLLTYRQAKIWIEKVPLFIISFGVSCYMIFIHADRLHEASRHFLSFSDRLGRAFDAYIVYIFKLFWPSRLTLTFSYESEPQIGWVIFCGCLLLLLTYVALFFSKSQPYIFVSWFWYLGTIVPVSGIVATGPQVLAYRYTYLSIIGLLVCLVWGVGEWLLVNRKLPSLKWLAQLLCGFFIFSSITASYLYTSHWRDSLTLFSYLNEHDPENYKVKNSLAAAFSENNNYSNAFKIYSQLMEKAPDNRSVLNGFGLLLAHRNDRDSLEEAEVLFKKSLEIEPTGSTYVNLGIVLAKLGEWEQAAAGFDAAIQLDSQRPKAFFNYGLVLLKLGDVDSAKHAFHQALVLDPTYQKARDQLARL